MSKTGIGLTVLFIGLALFQVTRGLFDSTPAPLFPSDSISADPSPTPTETSEPKPFPSPDGPRPKDMKYESTEDLVAALDAKGIQCTSLERLEQNDPTLSEFSLCDPGASEQRFNIYFYDRAADRSDWLTSMEQQQLPLPLIWGPNWIIVAAGDPETAQERLESIRGAIGGTIEDFSPTKKKG